MLFCIHIIALVAATLQILINVLCIDAASSERKWQL